MTTCFAINFSAFRVSFATFSRVDGISFFVIVVNLFAVNSRCFGAQRDVRQRSYQATVGRRVAFGGTNIGSRRINGQFISDVERFTIVQGAFPATNRTLFDVSVSAVGLISLVYHYQRVDSVVSVAIYARRAVSTRTFMAFVCRIS